MIEVIKEIKLRTIQIIILLLVLTLSASAQVKEDDTTDKIQLRDGSVFIGKMLSWEGDSLINFKMNTGYQFQILTSEVVLIEKVSKKELDHDIKTSIIKEYHFKEKGIYGAFNAGLILPSSYQSSNFEAPSGLFAGLSGGYMINRLLGVGFYVGRDNYGIRSGEVLYPVAVEFRGYLKKKHLTPFYTVQAGYGFPLEKAEFIVDIEGGRYIRTMVGIRIGARDDMNLQIGLGYRHQKAFFEKKVINWWGGWDPEQTTSFNLQFNRFEINMGVLF